MTNVRSQLPSADHTSELSNEDASGLISPALKNPAMIQASRPPMFRV